MYHYMTSPSGRATTPESLQAFGDLASIQQDGRHHLFVFLHPRCPCGRATIDQLTRLMPFLNKSARIVAYVYRPAREPAEWAATSIIGGLNRMPSIDIQPDLDGRIATRFGVLTSGHVLLYTNDGRLRFSGCVTNGRGHAGDSMGAASIKQILRAPDQLNRVDLPVYGCAIHDKDVL